MINILKRIVDETDKPYINETVYRFNLMFNTDIPYYKKGKGLSIGAMTSQFLAIFYLNDLDHVVKEREKCRYYIRYMDDLLFFSHDKNKLKRIYQVAKEEIEKLELKINPKSALYNCSSGTGFPFLGYRYYIDKRNRLRIASLAKTRRRIKKRLKNLQKFNYHKYLKSVRSYKGYFMNETFPPSRLSSD